MENVQPSKVIIFHNFFKLKNSIIRLILKKIKLTIKHYRTHAQISAVLELQCTLDYKRKRVAWHPRISKFHG